MWVDASILPIFHIHKIFDIFNYFIGFYTLHFGLVTLKMTCDAEVLISFDPVSQIS